MTNALESAKWALSWAAMSLPWSLPTSDELEAAAALIRKHVPPTPAFTWPLLNERAGCEVWVKHENHTAVGAFKVRGGLVYLDELVRSIPGVRGIIAATRGNHGLSMSFAAQQHGRQAVIVVPHGNSPEKNDAMRALGADLIEHGHDFQASLEYSAEVASARELHFVPSFHPWLVRGVGTYALEFLRAAPELDVVYVPVGLGSGICGMMAARAALGLKTSIVGVVSAAAPAYAISMTERRPVSYEVSTRIADGMACRTPNADALGFILSGVERLVSVTDEEVEAAMRALFADTHNVAEGAGAATLAALLREKQRLRGRKAGIVLSGGNVDRAVFARVLSDRA